MPDERIAQKVEQLLKWSRQALDTGRLALEHQDYIGAVNRAYYAIFYAANALLSTKGLERSKHSGVIAAFRHHFVKTGLVPAEYSDFYGAAMQDRHAGDYGLVPLSEELARRDLERAERFTRFVEQTLREMEVLR
jgi:uncharacterized protein (UPF0332 family)